MKRFRFLSKDIHEDASDAGVSEMPLNGDNGPDPVDMPVFENEPVRFDHASMMWKGTSMPEGFHCNMLTEESASSGTSELPEFMIHKDEWEI